MTLSPMTCFSCRHSIGTYSGLQCSLTKTEATVVCLRFVREMGTDEQDRGACE